MKCEDIDKLLTAYLDKEVTHEERRQIEAHLSTCEKCREELRRLDSIREQLRQALKVRSAEVEPSPQAWDLVRQRIISKSPFWGFFGGILNSPAWRMAIPVALVIVALGALWGTGVLPRLVGFEQASAPVPPVTFAPGPPGSASYASNYEDMGELCSLSDLIVVGTVDRVIEVVRADYGPDFLYDARSAFRIETVLKGKASKEIVLTHMALAVPNGWMEGMAEDPPLEAGERWVFFLKVTSDGSYHNFGPWGRYKIIDDKVYSMNWVVDTWYREEKLDFNGVSLSSFISEIKGTLDSVVLTFVDSRHNDIPHRAMRFSAGAYQTVNVNLSTGKYGGDLTYTVKRVESKDSAVEIPMPDGLDITVEPAQFTAYARHQYQSTLKISTMPDLPPGTYWVRVEYQLGKSVSGYRTLMVNINPSEMVGSD